MEIGQDDRRSGKIGAVRGQAQSVQRNGIGRGCGAVEDPNLVHRGVVERFRWNRGCVHAAACTLASRSKR